MTTTTRTTNVIRNLKTTRFGELNVPAAQVFTFKDGILGFPNYHEYAVLENQSGGPFEWLQCVQEPSLAFVIANPLQFKPDYRIKIKPWELEPVELTDPSEGRVAVILVIPKDTMKMTANLQGPIVFNIEKQLARQLVLVGDEYTTKYRIFQD